MVTYQLFILLSMSLLFFLLFVFGITNSTESAKELNDQALKFLNSNPGKASSLANRAFQNAITSSQKAQAGRAKFILAYIHDVDGYINQAAVYYIEALELLSSTKQTDGDKILRVLNNLGRLARVAGQYDMANQYYQEALIIAKEGLPGEISGLLHSIGFAHMAKEEYSMALDYLIKSLGAADGDYLQTAKVNNSIGSCYLELNRHESAYHYFQKVLESRSHIDEDGFLIPEPFESSDRHFHGD